MEPDGSALPAAPGLQPPPDLAPRLAVRKRDGSVVSVPRDVAVEAVTSGKATPATAEEYQAARAKKLQQSAGVGDQLGGLAYGGVSGVASAMGVPLDAAAVEISKFLGGDREAQLTRETLQKMQHTAPEAITAGQFGGFGLAALGGDEAGLVGALGHGAESTAVKALPKALTEGTGILSAAARAVPTTARVAAEGAALGVEDAVNEDAIENKPLTGEQAFASGLSGVEGGALLGAGFGLAGEALGTARRSLGEFLAKPAEDVGNTAQGISGHLANAAEDRVGHAIIISSDTKAVRALDALPGGKRAAYRRALEDGVLEHGDTVQTIQPKLETKVDELGGKIGKHIDELEAEHGQQGPRFKDVSKEIHDQLLKPLLIAPELNASKIDLVKSVLTSLVGVTDAETGRLSFRNAEAIKRQLFDQVADFTPVGKPTPKSQIFSRAGAILEDHVEQAIDAAKVGGSAEYKADKLAFRQYTTMNKAASKSLIKAGGNQTFGIGTKLFAAGAIGHFGLPGIIGGALHHIAGKYGNASAAIWLDKLSKMRALQRESSAVAEKTTKGLENFFAGREQTPYRGPKVDEKTIEGVRAVAADPHAQQTLIEKSVGHAPNHAPTVASQIATAHMRALNYLAAKLPRPLQGNNTAQPQLRKKTYSPVELQAFKKTYEAVTDPAGTLGLLGTGRLTRDHVDALNAVYPAMMKQVKEELRQKLTLTKKPLSFRQRMELSMLTGDPLDASLDQDYTRAMQAAFASAPSPASPGAQAPKRPLKVSGAMTSTDNPESLGSQE